MTSLPLKGIFTILFAGGAITGISTIPQLLSKNRKVPRLILGKGEDGKELYIRLIDLKTQVELLPKEEEEEDGGRNFADVDL